MEILKLSFSIIFIMTSYSEGIFNTKASTEIEFRLPNDVKPKHYWIHLKVDVENSVFYGLANISIFVYKQTDKISLYAKNLDIIHPTIVESVAANTTNRKHKITSLHHNYETGILSYFVDLDVLPDWYILIMEFKGKISDTTHEYGFFKSPYMNVKGKREWFVTTHGWATGIRQLFPCWDEPGFDVTFNIIVEHHKRYTALSNTPSRKVYVNDDIVRTHFVVTPAIPTYCITIVLCNLSNEIEFENVNLKGRLLIVEDLIFADHIIKNITHYFKDEWNQSNVFIKQQHFAVPNFRDDMAKWGFVIYREESIIYNTIIDPIARKMEVAYLIGRKIGRQWLNSISSSWKPNSWLNEGIATVLFTSDVIDKIIPNSRVSDLFKVQILQESLYLAQEITNHFTSKNDSTNINSDFSFFYYINVPTLLHSLQHMLSNKVFREGVKLYLKKQSTSLNDFLAAMQSAYDITTVPSQKFNITEIMYFWIKQNHYPVLHAKLHSDGIRITIQSASETWKYPVTLTKLSYMNFITSNTILIESKKIFFYNHKSVSKDELIIINLQQIGYYRVMYNIENWQRITRYLISEHYEKIHVLNRAQIIDDAFYFTTIGKLNASVFWNLTSYLTWETEYVAWYPMLKAIERISYIFPFPSKNGYLKTTIRKQLDALLQMIGYEDQNENYSIQCLRQEIVKWACVLDHVTCKKEALNRLEWHLTNPLIYKLKPGWKKWTYCNGLEMGNVIVSFKMYLREILFKNNRKILEFLACSTSRFLFSAKIGKHSIDNINLFHHIVAKHSKNNYRLNFILANLEIIKPKEISITTALIDIINHVYSKHQLDKIMGFVKNINYEPFINIQTNLKSLNSKIFYELHEFIRNKVEIELISDIQKKIDMRLSQIEDQMNTFVTTFGIW